MADVAKERWRRVEWLYDHALALPARERAAFLDRECEEAAIRREVETLLEADDAVDDFLERPALQHLAAEIAADAKTIVGRTVGGYRIDALLGAGGMGDVYQARDLKLERNVALKVLAYEGSIGAAEMRRFIEEARAASVLSHPNIVTVHSVGRSEDVAYIAMELVQGRTLRTVIAERPPTVEDALDVAIQLADALAAAHEAGVIHRDLKPENIMLTPGGLVKVLDFGIARRQPSPSTRVAAGQPDAAPHEPGSSLVAGTVGYMSPEQADGRDVDARSDQFSFGAIVYELLSGRRAFQRPTQAESVAAIRREEPPPLQGTGLGAVPRIVAVCLHKDPDRRHAGMRLVADGLRLARRQRTGREGRWSRRAWIAAAGTALVGATAAATWQPRRIRARVGRLAVLPFANVRDDESVQYLCDGLAGSLLRRLSRAGLEVKALSAVVPARLRALDPRTVGREVSADAVLTGTVERRAGRLSVTAELMAVADAARLWGGTFNRPQDDVLAMHDEIAASIVREAVGEDVEMDARGLTANPRAYDCYLRGVHHFRLQDEQAYLVARGLLQEAIAHDAAFALAHVTLASTYTVMAVDGYEDPAAVWPHSEQEVERALAIEPDLPDALAESTAIDFFARWDWAAADRGWAAALRSRRGEIQAELFGARALQSWALGRSEEATQFARAARQSDPLSALCVIREADMLASQGALDSAARLYEAVVRDRPDEARAYFGFAEVRRRQGRYDEAIDLYQRGRRSVGHETSSPPTGGTGGYAFLEREAALESQEVLTARAASGAYVSPLEAGRLEARLGRTRRALDAIEAALDERSPGLVFLRVDPAWASVRQEPRFIAAAARVGLPALP